MNIKKVRIFLLATACVVLGVVSALRVSAGDGRENWVKHFVSDYRAPATIKRPVSTKCMQALAKAEEIAESKIAYTPDYVAMKFPGGDVPADTGVCTDVVIRTFRTVGIDLQAEVHRSISRSRDDYPNLWGLKSADKNIDHRRVPNLMIYFKKHGTVLPLSNNADDYSPCDIVTWDLGGGLTHIGIVSQYKSQKTGRPLIIHHIGGFPSKEDMLFNYKVIGHFALLK